ncbi:MAG: FeoB-associated Cys-rich membrane protein [Bacteroidales bacterium]|nr:FeoB-associated Cys-rich membrane protein [Bacteroidales bacterium]
MQTLIVLLILAVTLFFAVRRIVRMLKGKGRGGCSCGCQNCPHSRPCNPSCQSPCHHNNLCSKPEDEKPLDL